MSAAPDPSDVGRLDKEVLRRFVAARTAGDIAAMDRYWEQLVTLYFDRVDGWVRLEARGRLNVQEREDAQERSLYRISVRLRITFQGSSIGEWIKAARKAVHYACVDAMEAARKQREREAPLDAQRSEDDDRGRYGDAERREAKDRRSVAEAQEDDSEYYDMGAEFLDWAVPKLPERPRQVFELSRKGMAVEEIMQVLHITADNVYQARRRAVQKLRELNRDTEP